jgi:hypothetical protein
MNTRNLVISVGIGGGAMGLLSAMPLISMGNCLLCLWVWAGAIFGVAIYAHMEGTPITQSEGALIGALSGLVGAVVVGGLSLLFGAAAMALFASMGITDSDQLLSQLAGQGIGLVAGFVFNIVLYPLIGALAGLIGTELFGKPGRSSAL